jgi:pimeloyl-ACP methyl ester carboxylesterase
MFGARVLFGVVAMTALGFHPSPGTPFGPPMMATAGAAQAAKPMFEDRFADLPGVRVRYQDTGPGKAGTVVFMHAGTGNSESWANQLEVFSKAGYRAIAYDRRNWGSTVVQPATGPQPGTSSDDLQALVEHLKIGKFHLVGLAAGAQVSIDYAAWQGDRLISLVLAGSLGPGNIEAELAEFSKRVAIPALAGQENARYREVGPSFRGGNPEGYRRWLDIESRSRMTGVTNQPTRSPNTYAKMETIRVRTLVMPGGADLLSPPAFTKLWAAHIKDAEWVLVGDSGHSINTEQPELFNRHVLGFIKGERFDKVPK